MKGDIMYNDLYDFDRFEEKKKRALDYLDE